MYYLNEYYKSHTYESVTLKKKRLKNRVKKRVFQTHLPADFLERIVRAIWGFTVYLYKYICRYLYIYVGISTYIFI